MEEKQILLLVILVLNQFAKGKIFLRKGAVGKPSSRLDNILC